MFDYLKFEEDLKKAVEETMRNKLDRKDDVYIMSIQYFPDITTFVRLICNTYSYLNKQADVSNENDYIYYKYCEEEWEIWDEFAELSKRLEDYSEEVDCKFKLMEGDDIDEQYEKEYRTHVGKMIEIGKRVAKWFRTTETFKQYPNLLVNFYMREYFRPQEDVEMFKELNEGADYTEIEKFYFG